MLRVFLLFNLAWLTWKITLGQSCYSQRYLSPIFNQVDVTSGILFGNADPYGLPSGQNLYLDIYAPTGDTLGRRPVIVYAFGGGFLIGTRNQPPIPYFGEAFAKRGFVFVAIDYRLGFNTVTPGSPERAVYRAVQDLRSAVRHLAERESQYRIDTNHIIYMGSSAGCFAGLHSAFMEESEAADFDDPIPLLDPENLGAINQSGNTDYNNRHIEPFSIVNLWGAIADTAFIEANEQIPVISFHGDQDNAVPYLYGYPFSYPVFPSVYGSYPIHLRLNQVGIPNELYTLVGYGHEPELLAPELRDTIIIHSSHFLQNLFKPQTGSILGPETVCSGQRISLSVSGAVSNSRYCWNVTGPAQVVSTSQATITLDVTGAGTIQVEVVEKNALDVSGDPVTFSIQAYPQPIAELNILSINELNITLATLQTNGNYSTFYPGNGESLNGPVSSYAYPQPGSYSAIWEVANEGCISRDTVLISVDTCPVAFFIANPSGLWVQFTALTTNTSSYQWDWGNGGSFQSINPNAINSFSQPGVYAVTLTVNNTLGCTVSFTDSVRLLTSDIQAMRGLDSVHIFPNPATTSFAIHGIRSDLFPLSVDLWNSEGKKIRQLLITETNPEFPVDHLTNGIYYLVFPSGFSNSIKIGE